MGKRLSDTLDNYVLQAKKSFMEIWQALWISNGNPKKS